MAEVLLAGKDWKARALLRAQLIEEGVDVEACESVGEAAHRLEAGPVLPALLIADLSASDDPSSDADQLAAWAAEVPTWIISSRTLITHRNLAGRGFELLLLRPVDVKELVQQIKQRLEKGQKGVGM